MQVPFADQLYLTVERMVAGARRGCPPARRRNNHPPKGRHHSSSVIARAGQFPIA